DKGTGAAVTTEPAPVVFAPVDQAPQAAPPPAPAAEIPAPPLLAQERPPAQQHPPAQERQEDRDRRDRQGRRSRRRPRGRGLPESKYFSPSPPQRGSGPDRMEPRTVEPARSEGLGEFPVLPGE